MIWRVAGIVCMLYAFLGWGMFGAISIALGLDESIGLFLMVPFWLLTVLPAVICASICFGNVRGDDDV